MFFINPSAFQLFPSACNVFPFLCNVFSSLFLFNPSLFQLFFDNSNWKSQNLIRTQHFLIVSCGDWFSFCEDWYGKGEERPVSSGDWFFCEKERQISQRVWYNLNRETLSFFKDWFKIEWMWVETPNLCFVDAKEGKKFWWLKLSLYNHRGFRGCC